MLSAAKGAKFSEAAGAFGEQKDESDDLRDIRFETEKVSVSRVCRERLGILARTILYLGAVRLMRRQKASLRHAAGAALVRSITPPHRKTTAEGE